MQAPSIAVVGEALIDLVPTSPTTYAARPGGGPANTAIALARLGSSVTMLARFGADSFGQLVREHLIGNGVDVEHAVRAEEPSSIAIVTRATDGGASYRFLVDGTADWRWAASELPSLPAAVAAVHSGSLALALADSPALESWLAAARSTATLSIDPNLRPGLLPADAQGAVQRWLHIGDIVKVSVEDIALIYPGVDPWETARQWQKSGPALVIVTAGADGARAFFGDHELAADAVKVSVVDTIGAGDAFTAGLLHALAARGRLGGRLDHLDEADVGAALGYAVNVAALTCTRPGADPPTATELSAGRATSRAVSRR
ncbi:MAG TPA: carbohydrate kinase [Mycobacteriales bacterium]|nr:carbohydrate kinase [Mycobacteriales bacterium]